MKGFIKKIGIVFTIAMVIEIGCFTYINNFYITKDIKFTSLKVNNTKIYKKEEIYTLPDGAENIKLSPTRDYVAYFKDEKIKLYNLKDKTEADVTLKDNIEKQIKIKDYKWIKDSNNLIIFGFNKENIASIISYDIKKNITNFTDKPAVSYKHFFDGDIACIGVESINSLDENIYNGKVYVKGVNKKNNKDLILEDCFWVWQVIKEQDFKVGKVKVISASNYVLYENLEKKTINRLNKEVDELVCEGSLIGTDDKKNVFYYEKETDGKINEIKVKSLETNEVKDYKLDRDFIVNDVFVTAGGNVFLNNKDSHKVTSVINKEDIKYDGDLIEINDECIVSNDGGKIILTYIK